MTALMDTLATGATTLCRCWALTRRDGVTMGFTDHDQPLVFDGITFRADTGMTVRALETSTGLSVNNTEAMGVLSDAAIREADIDAGRYDGAEVRSWLVNWQDVTERALRFRGTIGEIRRGAGAFDAELRGLTEALNQPQGRIYQRPCAAVLGDAACRVDLDAPGLSAEVAAEEVEDGRLFRFAGLTGFAEGWFEKGQFRILSGAAEALHGVIKADRILTDGRREIELWQEIRAEVLPGDLVRVEAGCDKSFDTCRQKFANVVNFRGFPDIPGDDWLVSVPTQSGQNTGGSLR